MRNLHPNSFLIDVRLASECPRLSIGSNRDSVGLVGLYSEINNENYIKAAVNSEYLAVYFGDRLHAFSDYVQQKCRSSWDPYEDNGCFVYFDQGASSITIYSDFLGSEIAYYWSSPDRVVISNRLDNFHLVSEHQADVAGLLQFLRDAYTVGDRTLLSGVKKTRPLSTVQVDVRTGELLEERSGRWASGPAEKASIDEVADHWKTVLDGSPETVLMLSAGWDSRLLLAANCQRINACYTHGDLRSREIKIAFDIASQYAPQIVLRALEESSYGLESLNERFDQLGHAFYPHWYDAAGYMSNTCESPISAGLFVEHFSGHYGVNSVGRGKDKLIATAKSMLAPNTYDQLGSGASLGMASRLLHGRLKAPWYLFPEWLSEQRGVEDETGAEIRGVLAEFQEEGTGGIQELFERFRLEHSGRQYFALQTKCGIPFNGYHHPFSDSKFAKLILSIPYRDRVNYRLSQAVLRQLDPKLLDWPMAATLISAKWPIVFQEASRGVRISRERVAAIQRKKDPLHLGWNNFEFLFGTNVFYSYIDHLKGPIWPKEQMRIAINKMRDRGVSGYSVFHMFSKILTADYLIYGEE